jgi:predicted metal-dependent enzyme (double-stranded beta helix superfamily)
MPAGMARLFYKPFGLLFSVLGGIVAGAIFKRVWRVAADEEEAPQATDRRRGWGEVAAAAAAEGAVFAGVKALIDRAGATGFERVTGAWPGDT